MELIDFFHQSDPPLPWSANEVIPWQDPDFSRRILKEHLSQQHDAASRRTILVNKHIRWIHEKVLEGRVSRILDLGCGPGLYTSSLSKLGHQCKGIDLSPAAIEYARAHSSSSCSYVQGDVRNTDFGSGFDLIMMIFGAFNELKPEDADQLLKKTYGALNIGGTLLLEATTFDAVYDKGNQPPGWYRAEQEFFAEKPYICLTESFWDEEREIAMERYIIVDVATAEVDCYVNSTQAYSDQLYREMLYRSNFESIQTFSSLTGKKPRLQEEMFVLLARKTENKL
jgi:SAM-dependent methyltransferase